MNDFTSVSREKVVTAGVILALVIALVVLFQQVIRGSGGNDGGDTDQVASTATETDVPLGDTPEPIEDAYSLLPYTEDELSAAAEVAREFAVAYSVVDPDESEEERLDRLREFAAEELAEQLHILVLPPPIAGGDRRSDATTAVAEVTGIRNVGAESVTYLVDAHITVDHPNGPEHETVGYAVTTVPEDDGWSVYAFQDASLGDSGEA